MEFADYLMEGLRIFAFSPGSWNFHDDPSKSKEPSAYNLVKYCERLAGLVRALG
jgi:hypothetical protein